MKALLNSSREGKVFPRRLLRTVLACQFHNLLDFTIVTILGVLYKSSSSSWRDYVSNLQYDVDYKHGKRLIWKAVSSWCRLVSPFIERDTVFCYCVREFQKRATIAHPSQLRRLWEEPSIVCTGGESYVWSPTLSERSKKGINFIQVNCLQFCATDVRVYILMFGVKKLFFLTVSSAFRSKEVYVDVSS